MNILCASNEVVCQLGMTKLWNHFILQILLKMPEILELLCNILFENFEAILYKQRLVFCKQHFYKQRQAEIGKNSSKYWARP